MFGASLPDASTLDSEKKRAEAILHYDREQQQIALRAFISQFIERLTSSGTEYGELGAKAGLCSIDVTYNVTSLYVTTLRYFNPSLRLDSVAFLFTMLTPGTFLMAAFLNSQLQQC